MTRLATDERSHLNSIAHSDKIESLSHLKIVDWNFAIDEAIDRKEGYELLLAYQPIAPLENLNDHSIFEALLRLRTPSGIHSAGAFIDAIRYKERIMLAVDRWVVESAAQKIKESGYEIWINASAYSIRSSHYPMAIANILADAGVRYSKLSLELSEKDPIDYTERLHLDKLSQNHRIAFDDVGSPDSKHCIYSYVRKRWVRGIKIDRTLTKDLLSDARTAIAVRNLMDLCKELSIVCIVEGVENEEQIRRLRSMQVEGLRLYCQGWAIGRPELDE